MLPLSIPCSYRHRSVLVASWYAVIPWALHLQSVCYSHAVSSWDTFRYFYVYICWTEMIPLILHTMDYTGVQGPQMDWVSSNLPEAWQHFHQHVEVTFTGPLKSKTKEEQCTCLMLWVGDQGWPIYNTWTGLTCKWWQEAAEHLLYQVQRVYMWNLYGQHHLPPIQVQPSDSRWIWNFWTVLHWLEATGKGMWLLQCWQLLKVWDQGSSLTRTSESSWSLSIEPESFSDAQIKSIAETEAEGSVHAMGKELTRNLSHNPRAKVSTARLNLSSNS